MDFCSECGSMILNGNKCPMCGCRKIAENNEVKKAVPPKNKAKTKGMAIPMLFSLIVILFVLAIFIMIIILITSIIKHKKNKIQK